MLPSVGRSHRDRLEAGFHEEPCRFEEGFLRLAMPESLNVVVMVTRIVYGVIG